MLRKILKKWFLLTSYSKIAILFLDTYLFTKVLHYEKYHNIGDGNNISRNYSPNIS